MLVINSVLKNLKNSIRIFKADLAKIFSNWVSMVVIGGIIFLPSLYAWFNIYASWDPYGNTGNIKVAIVNEDRGGSIRDSKVNIGESVVESLMENDVLGWVFLDTREKGLEQVNKGEVYATLIIPADFSEKIVTLVEEEPVKPRLEYYVNEKINAIAPKITDKGATAIQNQITTAFVETVADKIIDVMYSVGVELNTTYPIIERLENIASSVSNRIPKLDNALENLIGEVQNGKMTISRQDQNVVAFQNILGQLLNFNDDISESLKELSVKPEEVIPELKEDLVLIQKIFTDISSSTLELKESIETNKPVLISDIDTSISKVENTKTRLSELAAKTAELDKDLSSTVINMKNEMISILDEYEELLERLEGKLDDMDTALPLLERLVKLNDALTHKLAAIRTHITNTIGALDSKLAQLQNIVSKIEGLFPSRPPKNENDETVDAEQKDEEGLVQERDAALIADIDEILELAIKLKQSIANNTEVFGDAIYQLEDIISTLNQIRDNAAKGSSVENAISDVKAKGRTLSGIIRSIRTLIEVRTSSITDKLASVEELLTEVNSKAKAVQNAITNAASGGQEKIDHIINNINVIQKKLADVAKRVTQTVHSEAGKIQSKIEDTNNSLTELQNRLEQLKDKIEDKQTLETTLQDISTLTYNIGASLDNTIDRLDDDLIAKFKEKISQMNIFVNDVSNLLRSIQDELEYLREFGQRLSEKSEVLAEDIGEVKSHVPSLQKKVDKVRDKIKALNENVDIRELINQLTADNSEKSDFLASPVDLETTILYPMENYGTGLTPFYTTLCLWVGALLLTALLTTASHNADFKFTPVEEYFGKYYLFGLCAILQGVIASAGDIIVLGVKPQHSILFIMLGMLYSAAFMAIVYTFVALLGNIGKALGIIFLVVQLGGAGGTFPIQVTPLFFQRIYKFLPFTYAISGMREAIAGIYRPVIIKDIVIICLFLAGALIIGSLLKEKANRFLHKYSKQLGDSGVIGH